MVLIGSCSCPGSWSRTYGAHLHLQAREDPNPTATAVPPTYFLDFLPPGGTCREFSLHITSPMRGGD